MKKSNKLLSVVVVSSALLTTVAVATSSSTNNMKNINNVDMQLGITANNGGKSAKLSVHNVSMTNAFDLNIKVEGDVEFKNMEFTDYIKQNAITKVNYNESSKILNIVVTSDVDLAKGGILEIGNIVVDGANDVEYKILDNNQGITIVTPTYDEISDNDLQEIGDTQITVGVDIQPPVEDDTTNPPTEGEGDELPPSNEEQVPPADKPEELPPTAPEQPDVPEGDGENEEKPPINEDISAPTEDIEVTEGKDGYKIVTPKTEDALMAVINAILGADTEAKVVDVKEESSYYIYKVKYKKATRTDSEYGYIEIKVSKDIRAEQGLPGIKTEKPSDQKPEGDTQKPENNNNGSTGGSNASTGGNGSGSGTTKPDGGNTGSGSNDNDGNTSVGNGTPDNDENTSGGNSSNNTETSSPQTGDTSVLGFVAISVAALSGIFINNRKK